MSLLRKLSWTKGDGIAFIVSCLPDFHLIALAFIAEFVPGALMGASLQPQPRCRSVRGSIFSKKTESHSNPLGEIDINQVSFS